MRLPLLLLHSKLLIRLVTNEATQGKRVVFHCSFSRVVLHIIDEILYSQKYKITHSNFLALILLALLFDEINDEIFKQGEHLFNQSINQYNPCGQC